MSVGNDNQSVSEYRRGHRNVATALEHPQFFSGLEIVAADVMPSVNDNLPAVASARGVRYDGWRPEGRHIVARGAPQLFSCFDVKRADEGILLYVRLNNYDALVNYR